MSADDADDGGGQEGDGRGLMICWQSLGFGCNMQQLLLLLLSHLQLRTDDGPPSLDHHHLRNLLVLEMEMAPDLHTHLN